MLKIVVYDGGFGGELFADLLEEEIPVVEVTRVIDWRNAGALNSRARTARMVAEKALEPYFGKADLIVFANHLLSMTSLRYFRRRYPKQKFLGLQPELPHKETTRRYLILTTGAVARTVNYWGYVCRLRTGAKTLRLDTWPGMIDDGTLGTREIATALESAAISREKPWDIVLGCATFRDVEGDLKSYFHGKAKIYDGFNVALDAVCRTLKIRGGTGKKKR